jgi:hypothetical protein
MPACDAGIALAAASKSMAGDEIVDEAMGGGVDASNRRRNSAAEIDGDGSGG